MLRKTSKLYSCQSLLNRLIIMASKFFNLNNKTNAVSRLSSILVSFPFLLLEAKWSQISKKLIDFNMEKEYEKYRGNLAVFVFTVLLNTFMSIFLCQNFYQIIITEFSISWKIVPPPLKISAYKVNCVSLLQKSGNLGRYLEVC